MASELEQLVHRVIDARLLELRHLFHLDGVSQAALTSGDALAGGTVGGAEDAGGAGLSGSEDGGGAGFGGGDDGGAAGGGAGVDSMTPSYLTIDPTGAVGASFSGRVHAAGLDLDAGTSSTPPSTDRVRWIRTSDGAVIASEFGYSFGGLDIAQLLSQAAAAGDTSAVLLEVVDDLGGSACALQIQQLARGTPPSSSFAAATVLGKSVTLIDGSAQSSFPQWPGVGGAGIKPSAIWFGAVVGGTGAVRLNGSGAWAVTRTGVGVYTLQLLGGVSGVWAIPIVQCNEAVGAIAEVDYISLAGQVTTVTVKTFSGPFGFGAADINWSFSAAASAN